MNGHWMEGKEGLLNAAPLLTSILEQTDSGVILTDEDGCIIFTNGLASLLSDHATPDFTGKNLFDIYFGDATDLLTGFNGALCGKIVKAPEQKIEVSGLELWLEMTYQPFQLCGSRCVLITASDVTERVVGERRNRRIMAAVLAIKSMNYLDYQPHDADDAVKKIARLIVPDLADWCLVDRADESGYARNVTVASPMWSENEPLYEVCSHYPREMAFDIAHDITVFTAIITSQVPESMMLEVAIGEDPMRMKWRIRPSSFAILPLPGHEKGTMTLILTESGPPYTEEDRQWMEELARCTTRIIDGLAVKGQPDSPVVVHTMDDTLCAVAVFSGKDLKIVEANKTFVRFAGKDEQSIWGFKLEEVIPEACEHVIIDQLPAVASTGKACSGDGHLRIGQGPDAHYLRYSLTPVHRGARVPCDVMMICFDTTEEVAAGRKIPELESMLDSALAQNQAILNGVGEGLAILGPEGNVLQMNSAAAAMLGAGNQAEYVRSALGFDDIFEMLGTDGAPLKNMRRLASRALAGEAYHDFEAVVVPGNGRNPWTGSFSGIPVTDSAGNCTGALLIFRDITSQKRIETSLKLNEERLAALHKLNETDSADIGRLFEFGIEEMVRLTDSRAGCLLGKAEADDRLALLGFSTTEGQECRIGEKELLHLQKNGVWATVLTEKRPLVINHFAGAQMPGNIPEGHLELNKLLCVPVIENGKVVSIAAVANKEKDYDSYDQWQLSLFAGSLWRIISRKQAEEKLKKTLQEIDTRVSLRTEELYSENMALQKEINAHLKTEQELRDSGEVFRSIVLELGDGILIADREGLITEINYGLEIISGISMNKVIGKHIGEFWQDLAVPLPESSGRENNSMPGEKTSKADEYPGGLRLYKDIVRADGTIRNVNISTIQVRNGNNTSMAYIFRDVTDRLVEADKATLALKEKDALLKEINHRVKNNMQILNSLISLQIDKVSDEKARAILKDSQSRIKSMALIHEKLYKTADYSRIDFRDYIEVLARGIMYSYNQDIKKVRLILNVEKIYLSINTAVHCGLIINELITNSYKHAFQDDKNGEIRVDLTRTNQGYLLVISDNGIGIPESVNIDTSPTLGLQLVRMLVDQIGGKMEISRSWGTMFRISFDSESLR